MPADTPEEENELLDIDEREPDDQAVFTDDAVAATTGLRGEMPMRIDVSFDLLGDAVVTVRRCDPAALPNLPTLNDVVALASEAG